MPFSERCEYPMHDNFSSTCLWRRPRFQLEVKLGQHSPTTRPQRHAWTIWYVKWWVGNASNQLVITCTRRQVKPQLSTERMRSPLHDWNMFVWTWENKRRETLDREGQTGYWISLMPSHVNGKVRGCHEWKCYLLIRHAHVPCNITNTFYGWGKHPYLQYELSERWGFLYSYIKMKCWWKWVTMTDFSSNLRRFAKNQ